MPNAPAGTRVEISLPSSFHSNEADTLDDQRHFAYAYHIHLRDVTSVGFGKMDPTESRADTGTIDWVAARDKYFLITLIQPRGGTPFTGVQMHGAPRTGKIATAATGFAVQPVVDGRFGFELYAGPQAIEQLGGIADDLNNVNPYGSFLRPIVQPFTTITLRVLIWMKNALKVNYGWVLILFGVLIRLLLWPLNQRAMRAGIQMQRLQPQLQEAQKKYKGDAAKIQEETMKVYREHGMSPLSPLLGCLPMLLPFPILYALYYVFQNTIEFRGVPFLWMTDLSLRDPYYITPIVMGASMFLLSWIGMRNGPSNPQTKMMSVMMPVVFTAMFLNLASGLNLYYAVQNMTSLPQQWMLSRERAKSGPVVKGVPAKAGGGGGGGGSKRSRG
jgi:YidC/Oxa1 family membrane protein insertase